MKLFLIFCWPNIWHNQKRPTCIGMGYYNSFITCVFIIQYSCSDTHKNKKQKLFNKQKKKKRTKNERRWEIVVEYTECRRLFQYVIVLNRFYSQFYLFLCLFYLTKQEINIHIICCHFIFFIIFLFFWANIKWKVNKYTIYEHVVPFLLWVIE